MNEIPFDKWTQIPDEELAKKNRTAWVYRPSNYPGPCAIDATIRKETDADSISISLTREEAEIIWPKNKKLKINDDGIGSLS